MDGIVPEHILYSKSCLRKLGRSQGSKNKTSIFVGLTIPSRNNVVFGNSAHHTICLFV